MVRSQFLAIILCLSLYLLNEPPKSTTFLSYPALRRHEKVPISPPLNAQEDENLPESSSIDGSMWLVPKECTKINFHDWKDQLEQHSRLIHDVLQPDSNYYSLIRSFVDPLALEFPFDELFKLKVPVIGGYQASIKISDANVYNFVPTEIRIVPAPDL